MFFLRFDSELYASHANVTELKTSRDRLQREKDRIQLEKNDLEKEIEVIEFLAGHWYDIRTFPSIKLGDIPIFMFVAVISFSVLGYYFEVGSKNNKLLSASIMLFGHRQL